MTRAQRDPILDYEKYRLDNGLDVILLEDHRLPLVAVNIWYHVGPANERPGLTGFAHLFEHMMFEGSRHVGVKEHIRYLEAAGATEINGTTDFDRTNYFETVPSDQLELALWLESDRMGFLLDKLDAANLENQRDVVRNERRQSVESAPYGLVQEALFHQLFHREHPYYASVIGSHADIEAARLSDVREFFRLYYAPNNASLAVVGDIDRDNTKALVEKYFSPIPPGPPVPRVKIQTPPVPSERRSVVPDRVELPRVYMAWLTPPIFQPGDAECDLIGRILGGGKSSRLYRSLVYEKRIAQDVSAQQYSLSLTSVFVIEATAKPGVSPESLEQGIDEEVDGFKKAGPTPEELDGARNITETHIIRGLETLGGFGGIADRLNLYNHFIGDPGYLARDLLRYRKASVDDLRSVAETSLDRRSRVVVYGVPGEKQIDDVPRSAAEAADREPDTRIPHGQEWRAHPPAAAGAGTLRLPVPTTFVLSNGLTVYLVETHHLPIVSANLIVLSGSEFNPLDRPGLASFAADMLDEGTTARTALEIARAAEQLGATLSTGSSADYSFLKVRALKRNVEAAFELLSDILLNPSFPDSEIERVRHDRLTLIRQQRDNPGTIATKAFFGALYGPAHPYGFPEIGTEDSVRTIERSEIIRFWQEGYRPRSSALVVAGDLTNEELGSLAERYFGSWSGDLRTSQAPPVTMRGSRRVVIVDRPGLPQTSLRLGHLGVPRTHPDFIPIDVMNTALGGLFSSRINLNLREMHGYTYGASSSFSSRRGRGPFLIATSVRTDSTAQAVEEIVREVERMRVEELTARELATARESIIRSLPGLFETSSEAASSISQLFIHALPMGYYRTLPAGVAAVDAGEVRRVALEHLRPGELIVVAVGDREKIQSDLEALDLGRIESADPDGNVTE
ncbi:MAG: insulinase family protein [Acidobacteria bacterium]|nr:insulinase family protein [Acidobacteriota bacterium]